MKIIALEAENLKRLRAVHIEPKGPVVEIAGKNGAGKTSVLDAIWWAICGSKNVQAQPIRKGEEEARIRLDLGEIVVTRRFRKNRAGETATEVVVENAEGARFSSPQAMLDALTGELAFDPLAFARAPAKSQFDMLRKFVPEVDFEAIDAANKADFQKRTDTNRRAKEARAAADVIGVINPVEPVDVQRLVAQLEESGHHNSDLATRQARRDQARADVARLRADAKNFRDQIEDLQEQIERLTEAVDSRTLKADDLEQKLEAAEALPEPIETTPIRAAIQQAEQTNRAAARYDERQAHLARAKELEEESEKLTLAMAARKEAKDRAIAAAKMPVEGLSFGDGEILLNGVPFDQGSDAEQLRASVAIAAAMNPKLRVIRVRDGSLLDDDAMQALAVMAAERDLQIWIERVGESVGKFGVVIRDGSVVEQTAVAAE
jgi:DNA repair exonuclease SbcCD ATPase subunit